MNANMLANLHNVDLNSLDMDELEEMEMMENEEPSVRKFRTEREDGKRNNKQATLSKKQARAAKREF
jgi:hypothetical protein